MTSSSQPKKLVVLDLNGTLVVRSKFEGSKGPRMRGAYVPPAPRVVYSRPYLRTFRKFLTHPSTRAWLDSMVWSSAQPKSIESMVAHAFPGDARQALTAVWTRDDMGLTQQEYYSKTQTTKDLEKVWQAMRRHSGKTTVLVDDSVLKAHTQPFNHLCLPEYTLETRDADIAAIARGKHRKTKDKTTRAVTKDALDELVSSMQAATISGNHNVDAPGKDGRVPAGVDAALLAVVGIISRLKDVRDVAAWIEGGNIMRPAGLKADKGGSAGSIDHGQAMWFHNTEIVQAWAQEGVRVLDEMGITVAQGIEAQARA
ncbi:uncharacterized protein SCHCODRAFT_02596461 [Schizophyllum commune H4-8]|uniref:Mitochondrial import inner membrane translocase subunit TIM50 n=1 Tax=Schizophyllum commune (strain H4-8 / FGSC 9210) TaxID=578458 RepID=D8PKP8_SCHCM|nr:uncharacterized protein SCHCODRAFT_02596461 [Schizophyllum commune H4-8]KAI5897614.1 hypothetical protein SCHCODRAFT_02596461 [Schizophyllum commune H4-8]